MTDPLTAAVTRWEPDEETGRLAYGS
jgi:hypothetical protein